MKTLIFADVHLKVGPAGEQTQRDFVDFLRWIDPGEFGRVIILGDLFDFWFEYRHVVFSGYFDTLRAFADLRERGVAFDLICGNHDLWAGRFLEETLGFSVHRDQLACTLEGTRMLFVHGDGVNPSDRGYRIYKRFARSPVATKLFRAIHPDWAMALARAVSHSSRKYLAPDDPGDSREVHATEAYARRILSEGDADVLLCGHTHYPVEMEIDTEHGTRLYINTGDWMDMRTFLVWDGTRFERGTFSSGDGA